MFYIHIVKGRALLGIFILLLLLLGFSALVSDFGLAATISGIILLSISSFLFSKIYKDSLRYAAEKKSLNHKKLLQTFLVIWVICLPVILYVTDARFGMSVYPYRYMFMVVIMMLCVAVILFVLAFKIFTEYNALECSDSNQKAPPPTTPVSTCMSEEYYLHMCEVDMYASAQLNAARDAEIARQAEALRQAEMARQAELARCEAMDRQEEREMR